MAKSADRDTERKSFELFRASDARDYGEHGIMDIVADSPAIVEGLTAFHEAGGTGGQKVSMAYSRPGFSLSKVWFKSGYPLPLHAHDSDCLYYIVSGSVRMGAETLGPGDGFFVGSGVPYTYETGPDGVEVLEFRNTDAFNIRFMAKGKAAWDKTVAKLEARRADWVDEVPPSQREKAGAGGVTDPLIGLVDPELREAALIMRATMAAYSPMTREKLDARRAWMAENALAPRYGVPFFEIAVPRPVGCGEGPEIGAFVVNASAGRDGPGILHMHGGGFTASRAAYGLGAVQALAAELGCTIVTVDYRLAPETIWSGSLGDNYATLLWMRDHAAEIGVDPARIALLGESAGGGHAALLALAARDRGEVSLVFQALVYPMLDDRSGTSRAVAEHIGYFGWGPEANRFGWESFLGCAPGGPDVPREAVPARVADLAGLPPTWIGVGGLDLFVDEDIAFARRLNDAGVPTELLLVPGAFHGFDSFVPGAAVSRRFTAAKVAALRRGLGLARPAD